jgi:large subunit ribosomal protein L25
VPFHTHGRAAGVVQGGILNVTRRTIPLRTTPARIPVSIDVDVTELALKDSIAVEDIELPEGVVCTLSPKLTLAIVLEPRKAVPLPGEEAAPGSEATAEGEAAKKAAG